MRVVQGFSLQIVASNLCVDPSTVHRTVKKFELSGTVEKKKYHCDNHSEKKLTDPIKLTVLNLVLQKPSIYLSEIQYELLWQFGIDVSPSSLCKFLKQSNFRRKKMQLVALQRDQELRSTFLSDVSIYDSQNLVFIDETGCDKKDAIRRYGYGLRGKPVQCQKLLVRGKRVSVIAAMSVEGLLDVKLVKGTVTGAIFTDFLEKQLLSHLMPLPNPHSIIIMDNCSVHHVGSVHEVMEGIGVIVHYLPPYSPDYNPIELLFSKVKLLIKQMELESTVQDIETIILAAFASITKEDCIAWIHSQDIYKNVL